MIIATHFIDIYIYIYNYLLSSNKTTYINYFYVKLRKIRENRAINTKLRTCNGKEQVK